MSYYHFRERDPKSTCQRCGFDFNRSALRKDWRGLWLCHGSNSNDCWEMRNQQEFVRGVADRQHVRGGAVPDSTDVFKEPSFTTPADL